MRRIYTTKSRSANPDMTPMLDIVFIMLIFFIVTASFIRETALIVNFPKGNPPGPLPSDAPISFQVDGSSRILHGGRLIDHWSIGSIVRKERTERPEAPVVITTHRDAHTRQFIRIHDEAVKAGMERGRIAVVVSSE